MVRRPSEQPADGVRGAQEHPGDEIGAERKRHLEREPEDERALQSGVEREAAVVEEPFEMLLAAEHEWRDQRELPRRKTLSPAHPSASGLPDERQQHSDRAESENERQ